MLANGCERLFLLLSIMWACAMSSHYMDDIVFGPILFQCTTFLNAMVQVLLLGVLVKMLFGSSVQLD